MKSEPIRILPFFKLPSRHERRQTHQSYQEILASVYDPSLEYAPAPVYEPAPLSKKTKAQLVAEFSAASSDMQSQMELDSQRMKEQIAEINAQSKSSGDMMKIRLKCLIIAGRIIAGDNVPDADHKFLVKHDLGLYLKAITLRVEREDPKEHTRLSRCAEGEEICCGSSDVGSLVVSEGSQHKLTVAPILFDLNP